MARALSELTAGLASVPPGLMVSDVTLDSRAAKPGSLFLACRGHKHHGLDFAPSAIGLGASAVLYENAGDAAVEQTAAQLAAKAPTVFFGGVPQLSRHVGTIADRFFGAPSQSLDIAGITGTN